MISSTPRTTPSFFGPPERRLFGCYDPPLGRPARPVTVVLCYPAVHEYVASHRAMRQLATRLTSSGFGVFRFDYFGTGDSAGDGEDFSIESSRRDTELAIAEALRQSGRPEVSLIGLRLGGTVAALVSIGRRDVARMVLWDPVVDGRRYFDELVELEGTRAGTTKDGVLPEPEGPVEIMGFTLSSFFRRELSRLDLTSARCPEVEGVLILETRPGSSAETLAEAYRRNRASVRFEQLESPDLVLESVDRVRVPAKSIQAIASWLPGETP